MKLLHAKHGSLMSYISLLIPWEKRPGQLESPKRSPRTLPAEREPFPLCHTCQPSAAAPRSRPLLVRTRHHAPPRVRAAQRSGAPAGPGLDAQVVDWVYPHERHTQRHEIHLRSEHIYIVFVLKLTPKFR